MNHLEIIDCLGKLNFTKLEAQIYLVLLEGDALSGYQIAKKIDVTRPSIYNALEHMYDKGIVLQQPGNKSTYIAERPEILFKKLNAEYAKYAKKAEEGLTEFLETRHEEQFSNFKGFETVIFKTKEVLAQAKSEVYINTDFELSHFQDEFRELKDKGIRVIVFSFPELDLTDIDVEYYSHYRANVSPHAPSRMMIVADGRVALIANTYKERDTWLGSITNNPLMISIITEHIHNDIHLLKLRDRHGPGLFDDEIKIHTPFEIRSKVNKKP